MCSTLLCRRLWLIAFDELLRFFPFAFFSTCLNPSSFGDADSPHTVQAVSIGLREAGGKDSASPLCHIPTAWNCGRRKRSLCSETSFQLLFFFFFAKDARAMFTIALLKISSNHAKCLNGYLYYYRKITRNHVFFSFSDKHEGSTCQGFY